MNRKNGSSKVVGEVQMLRVRVAAAESQLALLREQAREAKRRRKEAKRLAQRARTLFKRGKARVADLRQSLARAEVKLFQAGGRALARKMAGARRVSKGAGGSPKKPGHVAGSRSSLASAGVGVSRRSISEISAMQRPVPVAPGCRQVATLESEQCPS